MRGRRATVSLVLPFLAALVAGCGDRGPSERPVSGAVIVQSVPLPVVGERSRNEQGQAPITSPPDPRAGTGPTPQGALRAFGERFINWDGRDVARVQSELAQDAVDGARSMLLEAARRSAPTLRAHGTSNRGQVRAVARDARGDDSWIVVTRETSDRRDGVYAGLGAQWHLTIATVRRLPSGRWAVSSWDPVS